MKISLRISFLENLDSYVKHQLLWYENENTVDACSSLLALSLVLKQKPG